MFQELLKNKTFKSKVKHFFEKNEAEILDIILFGSVVKGKDRPKDIDIILLFKNKEKIEIAYLLRKELKEFKEDINVITKNYNSLMSENFIAKESFLSEGYSLINNKFISEEFGYTNFMLFKYELIGFSQSKRMRFQYSLYGRNKAIGMIKELSLIKFSDSILLSYIENSEKTKEYLNSWNIKFEEIPILIPNRLKLG